MSLVIPDIITQTKMFINSSTFLPRTDIQISNSLKVYFFC